jgi:putative selenium metabolism protein SsnA
LGWVKGVHRLLEGAVLIVEAGKIAHLGLADEPLPEALQRNVEGAKVVDLPMGLALPGLANAHHHAYSALARGMPIAGPMRDFEEVLAKLWWPLDRSLSMEAVELSALLTAMDCVRSGVTSLADHHASPSALRGSLEVVARALGTLGLRALLSFEISDRYGEAGMRAALEENLSFAQNRKSDSRLRGLLGLHASFTLCDQTLGMIAAQSPAQLPIHVHVAEDKCDVEHAKKLGYPGPLMRLASFGLLRPRSLVVHGVHLSDDEIPLLQQHDAYVVHNPESNANNRVGTADLSRFPSQRVLIGTDGMGSNILGSLRAAFLSGASTSARPDEAMERTMGCAWRNTAAYFEQSFGEPCGRIEVGQEADFAIFDYPSPTPLTEHNLDAHLLYGLSASPVARWVYAHGQLVLDDGRFVGLDVEALLKEARQVAAKLWKSLCGAR